MHCHSLTDKILIIVKLFISPDNILLHDRVLFNSQHAVILLVLTCMCALHQPCHCILHSYLFLIIAD